MQAALMQRTMQVRTFINQAGPYCGTVAFSCRCLQTSARRSQHMLVARLCIKLAVGLTLVATSLQMTGWSGKTPASKQKRTNLPLQTLRQLMRRVLSGRMHDWTFDVCSLAVPSGLNSESRLGVIFAYSLSNAVERRILTGPCALKPLAFPSRARYAPERPSRRSNIIESITYL